uniref:Uncharacterized protein n=1 Tax=viral metagenome TaxID=1070528 RepID=A0A6H1Z776_9ZZZZ
MVQLNEAVIIDSDNRNTKASVTIRGAKGAIATELLDASGNQITSFGAGEQYLDNEPIGAKKGTIALGTDGVNYQMIAVDASGHLQADVLSGGGAGEQYPDNEPVVITKKGTIALGTDGTNYQILSTDTAGKLITDISDRPLRDAGKIDIAGFDTALPVGSNLIGRVSASQETNTIFDGTVSLTPKFKIINATLLGSNIVIAAVPTKKIRVLQYSLVCQTAVSIYFEFSGVFLTGIMTFANNGGISSPFSPVGLFETLAGYSLLINLSVANVVGGHLVYIEV